MDMPLESFVRIDDSATERIFLNTSTTRIYLYQKTIVIFTKDIYYDRLFTYTIIQPGIQYQPDGT